MRDSRCDEIVEITLFALEMREQLSDDERETRDALAAEYRRRRGERELERLLDSAREMRIFLPIP